MTSLNRTTLALCFGILIFINAVSFAQKNKGQLEKEKNTIQNQIKETEQILSQTSSQRKASLGQLNVLNQNIREQNKLISAYNGEINLLAGQIEDDNQVIRAMNKDLEQLKNEYGILIYSLYKTDNSFNRLSYLFASRNLGQFYMRYKYMEQYSAERKNQVKLIGEIKSEIEEEIKYLEQTKTQKSQLLADQLKEKDKLNNLMGQQAKVIESLKKEEQSLTKDLKKKQNEIQNLEKLISRLLTEEVKKVSKESKTADGSPINLTLISSSFEKNKSELPWPVSTGFISEKFGNHPHPVLKRVTIPNDGVNIQTKQDEQVKAVFDGVVKKIAIVPGDFKYVVIMQHGSYYTVYAKLKSVSVKMGQQVSRQDVIGEVNTDGDGVSEVQFQVWKNTEKLDPELWLARR